MSKKKLKYKRTKGAIDTQDAALKAIQALDIAGLAADKSGDAGAMAVVGLGWAVLSRTVYNIESNMRSEIEESDLRSETQIVNRVGFGPQRPWDLEEEEDDED